MAKPSSSRASSRLFWLSATAVLVVVLSVLVISPQALAQSNSASSAETQRALTIFEQVFRFVQNNYVDQLDADTLLQGALDGMFESLDDPHSAYLDTDAMRSLNDTTTGEFGGLGIYISKQAPEEGDENDDGPFYIEVISPIEDTPADRAGIRSGDLIVAVEGNSTAELNIDEVVNRLRGRPGTSVDITIQRGARARFDVAIERAIIEVPTVREAMIPGDIGFLRIIQFTPNTADRVREAVRFFEQNDYQSMIIDLRGNPGGLLSSVISTADLFFDDGLIVGTRGRVPTENQRFTASNGITIPPDRPIVVLINEGSASAAEILAGALKDRDRALLVGETTYGKGSVQQIRSIGSGGFRLTMSRYFTPSGDYIDEVGVSPDREVSEPELSDEAEEDYAELRQEDRIETFARENPDAGESEIGSFITALQSEGVAIGDRYLRRLIQEELNVVNNVQPVYDLEFDIVLQEAVELLRSGAVSARE